MSLVLRHAAAAVLVSSLVAGSVAACSGSSPSVIPDPGGVDAGPSSTTSSGGPGGSSNDGSTSNNDGSVSTNDSGGVLDSGTDAGGGGVNEEPAPDCHDLVQQASLVTAVGNLNQAPAQVPISTIALGTYTLTSAIDYGGALPVDPASTDKTTVVFTETRQYYLSETASTQQPATTQRLTLDWKLKNNHLTRTILCTQDASQTGTVVDYRIDGAPNGFIIYVPVQGDDTRMHAFRYKHQ